MSITRTIINYYFLMLGTCNVVAFATSNGKFFSDGHLMSFMLTLAVLVTVVDLGVADPVALVLIPVRKICIDQHLQIYFEQ